MNSIKRLNHKGQFEMSFGMTFSIILIIAFLAFAVYAILKFLEFQESIKITQFESNLQSEIDKMWRSSQGSQKVEYSLPKKIGAVCFIDDEYQNMIFDSERIIPGKKINNIDIKKIIGTEKQFCIDNVKEKVNMILKKDYGEALVTITKQ